MCKRCLLPLAAAAAFAAPLGLAAPALAHSGAPTKKSTRFAGYDLNTKFSGPAVNKDVTATIIVPKLKCTKTNRAIGVNAGLFEDSMSNPSSGGLFVGCVNGKARYYPFLTINGHKTTYPGTVAHVGDEVTVEADVNPTETEAEVFDHTQGWDKSKTGATYSHFVGWPWIGDRPWKTTHGTEGVPNFGKITFSTATIVGAPFGDRPHLTRFNRYKGSTLQISTGNFASSEMTFSTVFKHS